MQDATEKEPRAEGKERGRVLALDYGRRRIGVAVSDELRLTVTPLATIERSNRRADLERIRALAREQRAACIIIGLPLRLDGTPGAMAEEAREFATQVAGRTRLPVELVDERLSSWQAAELLREIPGRRSDPRRTLDDIAAAVILKEYLHRGRSA